MENPLSLFGKEIAITGRLVSMPRAEAVEKIRDAGGTYVVSPGPSTAILVSGPALGHVNPEGGMSRNLERFGELKDRGAPVRLVEETDFLRMLGAEDELADFSRLYTAVQVSRIVETPLSQIRSWLRHGLLQAARMTNRLAWFEYRDILLARNLSRLSSAGVATAEIRRGLSQIARWLPDAAWIFGRLDAAEAGLRVRMNDGGWAEPSGQRLLDFEGRPRAAVSIASFPSASFPAAVDGQGARFWFARALDAEEAGDLGAAAAGYRRALDEERDAVTCFNLGNVLYELGQEADAAECYLSAVSLDPNFTEAWNNMGNALAALGKLEDALPAYERALSVEPGYPDAHCNLALVLERLGKRRQAAAHRAACSQAYPPETRLRLLRAPFMDDWPD